MSELKMFPVLTGKYPKREGVCVPWALVAPHEERALKNHSQTLDRLAERGGLSACELAAVLEDRHWVRMPEDVAWAAIFRAVSVRPEALPIPTSERLPEYQQNVLLWLVTVDPKNSGWVLGQRSSHEEGKFWDGERYRPMQWITHWKPLPAAPSIPSPLRLFTATDVEQQLQDGLKREPQSHEGKTP